MKTLIHCFVEMVTPYIFLLSNIEGNHESECMSLKAFEQVFSSIISNDDVISFPVAPNFWKKYLEQLKKETKNVLSFDEAKVKFGELKDSVAKDGETKNLNENIESLNLEEPEDLEFITLLAEQYNIWLEEDEVLEENEEHEEDIEKDEAREQKEN